MAVKIQADGTYRDPDGTHRDLTKEEVADLRAYAQGHTPSFQGPHNAPFESHHPIAREEWAKKGVKPEAEKAKADQIAALEKQLAELKG